jgi:ubiquinone/menaquinone biosynthesis C-methylase UbiE
VSLLATVSARAPSEAERPTIRDVATTDRYRRIARFYDRFIEPMQAGVRSRALRVVPPERGWQVLDVGCGTGTGLLPYLQAGCRVSGVDVSAAMLAKATERLGQRADLHHTDGRSLPFSSDHFDLVMTTMVLHEVPSAERRGFLMEMGRVAKPDGRLLITDFHMGSLTGRGIALRGVTEVVERLSGHHSGYRSFKADGGAPAILRRAGLDVEQRKILAGGNVGIYVVHP